MAETEVILKADTVYRIADAIRAGREDADVTYLPSEMPDAIRSTRDMENALLARTVTEYVNSSAMTVGMRAFRGCDALERVSLAACTTIGIYAFESCTALTEVELPAVTFLNNQAFYGCTGLIKLVLPSLDRTVYRAFQNCSSLEEVDCGTKAWRLHVGDFYGCTALSRLILRKKEQCVVFDGSDSIALADTLIKKGMGHIYVPAVLIESYKTAEKWSAYASQFRVLEDYTVDGTITGALDMNKIGGDE